MEVAVYAGLLAEWDMQVYTGAISSCLMVMWHCCKVMVLNT